MWNMPANSPSSNPQIVYAGTWEEGVFKSTDGGGTWAAVNAGLTTMQVLALGIDPSNPQIIYAGTYCGGVYPITFAPTVPPIVTCVAGWSILPSEFRLSQNFPNPFNPSTTIRYELPRSEEIALAVYNLTGQRIATLASGFLEAGRYSPRWDGRDEAGRELASGVYQRGSPCH